MTDADDAELVQRYKLDTNSHKCAKCFCTIVRNPNGNLVFYKAYEAQRREIEGLRRERDLANEAWKGTRCAELREQERAEKADAALAEALLLIRDLRMHADGATSIATLEVASAFAAKHGGRDG